MKLLKILICFLTVHNSSQINLKSVKKITATVRPKPYNGRIIGGNVTSLEDFPYQVGIFINNKRAFCGGSLISHSYVLTAAHCGAKIAQADIVLGAHNLTTEEPQQVWRKAAKVIVHAFFNKTTFLNDIALIRLDHPVEYTKFIKPVILPNKDDMSLTYEKKLCNTSGWGMVRDVEYKPTVKDLTDVLMYVQVPVTKLKECGTFYNHKDVTYITNGNICTSGYRAKGTCDGDSGDPLVLNGIQIGIASSGTDQCQSCAPSIFTRVDQHLDWIEQHSDFKTS